MINFHAGQWHPLKPPNSKINHRTLSIRIRKLIAPMHQYPIGLVDPKTPLPILAAISSDATAEIESQKTPDSYSCAPRGLAQNRLETTLDIDFYSLHSLPEHPLAYIY